MVMVLYRSEFECFGIYLREQYIKLKNEMNSKEFINKNRVLLRSMVTPFRMTKLKIQN